MTGGMNVDEQCERGIIEVAEGPSVCAPAEHEARAGHAAVQEEAAFGTKVWLDRRFDETLAAVRRALEAEGFEVIGGINVAELLRADPGVRFPRYVIVQAWHPNYARQALQADMDIGLLLPHNIVVAERPDGTTVAVVDPIAQFRLIDGSELEELSVLLKGKLHDALDRVAAEQG